jgi:2-oxoglutarate ferredoxin oxidoreductase subunit delta
MVKSISGGLFAIYSACSANSAVKKAIQEMAGRIIIDVERCKGCGLCIAVCPKKGIAISKKSNKSGYFPAEAANSDCTGCAVCAIVCPDAAIEVQQDDPGKGGVVSRPDGKTKLRLVK